MKTLEIRRRGIRFLTRKVKSLFEHTELFRLAN